MPSKHQAFTHTHTHSLDRINVEETILDDPVAWARWNCDGAAVTAGQLASRLRLIVDSANSTALHHLFGIFEGVDSPQQPADGQRRIDGRAYWLCAVFLITRERPLLDLLRLVCKVPNDSVIWVLYSGSLY